MASAGLPHWEEQVQCDRPLLQETLHCWLAGLPTFSSMQSDLAATKQTTVVQAGASLLDATLRHVGVGVLLCWTMCQQ